MRIMRRHIFVMVSDFVSCWNKYRGLETDMLMITGFRYRYPLDELDTPGCSPC